MKRKNYITVLLILLFSMNAVYTAVYAVETDSLSETIDRATTINADLMEYYYENNLKASGSAIISQGFARASKFVYPETFGIKTNYFAIENAYGLSSFYKLFLYQGDSRGSDWATNDIQPSLKELFIPGGESKPGFIEYDDESTLSDFRDTYTQFVAMNEICEYYALSKDSELYAKVKDFYSSITYYEANETAGYFGKTGGYWTKLNGTHKYVDYIACNANTSLMAAAALSRFSTVIPDLDEALKAKTPEIIAKAEQAMSFCELYCYENGFYIEYDGDSSGVISLDTQALALDALAMLYQVTGKYFYLVRADALLQNIIECLWDTGRGGAYQYYNINTESIVTEGISGGYADDTLKWSYGNVLLADSLTDLYHVTDDSKYMKMAEEIMNFMFNYMWNGEETEGSANYNAYVGWCLGNGTWVTPDAYAAANLDPIGGNSFAKFSKTQSLAISVNSEITWANREWYVEYMWYLIGGGIALVAVIMAIILIARKRSAGRALPKVVKGLLGGED